MPMTIIIILIWNTIILYQEFEGFNSRLFLSLLGTLLFNVIIIY